MGRTEAPMEVVDQHAAQRPGDPRWLEYDVPLTPAERRRVWVVTVIIVVVAILLGIVAVATNDTPPPTPSFRSPSTAPGATWRPGGRG